MIMWACCAWGSQSVLESIKGKDVAKYVLLPGVIPRVKELAGSGFGWFAYLMAMVYASVRLLPPEHPYLQAANMGRYGIRHVIAEAAGRLKFRKENIDQIVVFLVLLAGIVVLIAQFALLVMALVVRPVFAGGGLGFASIFQTQNPTFDIAFMMMDSIFGIPDLFGSCVSTGTACSPLPNGQQGPPVALSGGFPTAFHLGLHDMFKFYNTAILLAGVLIFLYYVVITVGETATTGTPFGRRFNHIWAPLRLVAALGLLVPINWGLNSAQYITLFAAKLGSSFATNAWIVYNTALAQQNATGITPATAQQRLIADIPEHYYIDNVVQFMMIARACKVTMEAIYKRPDGSLVLDIRPYLIRKPFDAQEVGPGFSWLAAANWYNNEDILIRFGHKDNVMFPTDTGGVGPICGDITVHTKDMFYQGAMQAQQAYFNWVLQMWIDPNFQNFGVRAACLHLTNKGAIGGTCPGGPFGAGDNPLKMPPEGFKNNIYNGFRILIENTLTPAYQTMLTSTPTIMTNDIMVRGWGGAGMWYNKIAQWNGALQGAARNVPTPGKVPVVMELVREERRAQNQGNDPGEIFSPYLKEGSVDATFRKQDEKQVAAALNDAYKFWTTPSSSNADWGSQTAQSNVFYSVINMIFGLDGLFNMRTQDNVHPLAKLVALGKGMMDSAVRNLMTGLVFSAGGGMMSVMKNQVGSGFFGAIGKMAVSFTTISLSMGFVLYYVLPFLPFIYFFFAVSAWAKSIFEAMVGAPLWALAHLRIDGDGLPGQAAINGYFLIFEIFVRPILTVFGLIAAIGVFYAMVQTLNGVFTLVVQNTTGFECQGCQGNIGAALPANSQWRRDVIDEFFYTVIYTILVYLIALSSFKMIDQIPQNIMRWMGSGARSFSNLMGNPTENFLLYSTIGVKQVGGQLAGAARGAAEGGGRAVGGGVKTLTDALTTRKTTITGGGSGQGT